MNTPSRISSHRSLGLAAFALAVAVLGLQASPASAMDRARIEQDTDRADAPPERSKRNRPPAPPVAAPDARRDSRPPPTFAPSPGVAPRERLESRDRRDFRDRGEFRSQPGAVFAPPAARGFNYRPRPERVVPRVPPGYRQYYWAGTPYYHYGNRWYRPYGSSYLIVSAPFGLFVPYLPGYYSTFWYGGTRYYMADDTYYLYDPIRRGYTVTRSPYGNDRDTDDEEVGRDAAQAAELFIYPINGQSESQQAEDRYQCHRWAADQVHYDPTESEYRATERAEYDRAISACLTGRGYSVK